MSVCLGKTSDDPVWSARRFVYFITIATVASLLMCLPTTAVGSEETASRVLYLQPKGGVAFLPLRSFAAQGVRVEWWSEAHTAVARGKGRLVLLAPGTETAWTSGGTVRLSARPFLDGGRLMVPAEEVAGLLGVKPNVVKAVHVPLASVKIPNVRGKTERAAKAAIEGAGLYWHSPQKKWSDSVPAGRAIGTKPAEGWTERGSSVTLVISKGPQPECPYCHKKFNSQKELGAHLHKPLYACSRYPDCPFTADTPQEVIQHYLSQPEGHVEESKTSFGELPVTVGEGPCRSDAKVPFSNKWRVKVIPPPACKNIKHYETWRILHIGQ